MSATRVLVVEDDSDLGSLLKRGLIEEGFAVTLTVNGRDALVAAETHRPDLLVVDIGLPDADGRDVCQALRGRGVTAPLLFLTARDAIPDRISGFGVGGDDYLTKPFDLGELVARLRGLLRRAATSLGPVGDLVLDPATHGVTVGSAMAHLTPTEFRLLGILVARPGEAVRRSELVRAAWPEGAVVHDNTLDVYIARLRRKLAGLGSQTEIRTQHGVGYRLG